MNTHNVPTGKAAKKLSRKAVAAGLQAVPIDLVLLGSVGAKEKALTPKQRKFAEGIALGKTGSQSYRDAYDTKSTPVVQGHEAAKLKADPRIAMQIEALRLAQEAQKYTTPQALRSLVIQQLTVHALDDTIAPAQRLKALELLGKVTEVAAFTERREVIKSTDSSTAKTTLLETLRAALRTTTNNITDVVERGRLTPVSLTSDERLTPVSLVDEVDNERLTPVSLVCGDDVGAAERVAGATPPAPTPPKEGAALARVLHSIPDSQSISDTDRLTPVSLLSTNPNNNADARLTPVSLPRENPNGGWVEKIISDKNDGDLETPPLANWK